MSYIIPGLKKPPQKPKFKLIKEIYGYKIVKINKNDIPHAEKFITNTDIENYKKQVGI